MSGSEVGIAFLGTGGVARMHAQAVKQLGGASLLGAYSRNEENVRKFAAEFDVQGYRSIDEVLGDPRVDIVSVLTPVEGHSPLASACLEAGKHVLVEKPVAHTVEEIQTLQAAAERADRLCVPVHNYIYAPAIQRAKQLIDQGKLGTLSSLWMIYNEKHPAEMADGRPELLLRELLAHHAYVLLFLGGRPARVSATASNVHFDDKKSNDQAMIICEMPGGAIANLWGSFAADDNTGSPWTVYYKVLGTEGGVTYSWDDVRHGDAPLPGWDLAAYHDSFLYVYEYFLTRCLAQGEPPLSSLGDAADALRIIEATEDSVAEGRSTAVRY